MMKTCLACILLFSAIHAFGQSTVPVSSTGIGDIKINMTVGQVEKITGAPLKFMPNSADGYALDSVIVVHKGINITLEFTVSGKDDNDKPRKTVFGMSSSHPSLQTRSGFALGSDKFEIIKKLDGMRLTLQPDYRMESKADKSKYSMLMLSDGDNGTLLIMYFEANKLTGFSVSVDEGC